MSGPVEMVLEWVARDMNAHLGRKIAIHQQLGFRNSNPVRFNYSPRGRKFPALE